MSSSHLSRLSDPSRHLGRIDVLGRCGGRAVGGGLVLVVVVFVTVEVGR